MFVIWGTASASASGYASGVAAQGAPSSKTMSFQGAKLRIVSSEIPRPWREVKRRKAVWAECCDKKDLLKFQASDERKRTCQLAARARVRVREARKEGSRPLNRLPAYLITTRAMVVTAWKVEVS